jgi:hypothetical protein
MAPIANSSGGTRLAVISMPILSEIDYPLRTSWACRVRAVAFTLELCLTGDLARCAALGDAYRGLDLGLPGAKPLVLLPADS